MVSFKKEPIATISEFKETNVWHKATMGSERQLPRRIRSIIAGKALSIETLYRKRIVGHNMN